MATVSFMERVTTDAYLPTTLRTILGLASSSAVYVGRRPRKVRQNVEARLAFGDVTSLARAGVQRTEHRLDVVVGVRSQDRADGTGAGQSVALRTLLERVRDGLDGTRPWQNAAEAEPGPLDDLISVRAEVTTVDEEPEDGQHIEGTVGLRFIVAGPGVVTEGAGANLFGGELP